MEMFSNLRRMPHKFETLVLTVLTMHKNKYHLNKEILKTRVYNGIISIIILQVNNKNKTI